MLREKRVYSGRGATVNAAPFSSETAPAAVSRDATKDRQTCNLYERLVASAIFNPNWRADKSKGTADLVFQKALIGEM